MASLPSSTRSTSSRWVAARCGGCERGRVGSVARRCGDVRCRGKGVRAGGTDGDVCVRAMTRCGRAARRAAPRRGEAGGHRERGGRAGRVRRPAAGEQD
eukprot:6878669-Prymnesium_polylepis.2